MKSKGLVIAAVVLFAAVSLAATFHSRTSTLTMSPGDKATVTCGGPSLSFSRSGSRAGTLTCAQNPPPTTTTVPQTTTTVPQATTTTTAAPTTTTTQPPTGGNNCLANPKGCGFPDATTTGVPAGTVLTASGGFTASTPGATYSNLDISGGILVTANNVTIKDSRLRDSADYDVIQIKDGVTGTLIEDAEIDGMAAIGGENGILGPATMLRVNIWNVENGLDYNNNSSLTDSYIHDLNAPSGAHYDGVQEDGAVANLTVEHNTIINPHDQTSAMMVDNGFGPATNITEDRNLLSGGDYVVYADNQFNGGAITQLTITNNRFGTSTYGYDDIKVPVTQGGNVVDATGQALSL